MPSRQSQHAHATQSKTLQSRPPEVLPEGKMQVRQTGHIDIMLAENTDKLLQLRPVRKLAPKETLQIHRAELQPM